MKTAAVYVIKDPITNLIVYVGQTTNFEARIDCHKHSKNTSKISTWIRKLKAENKQPIFEIHRKCLPHYRYDYEFLLIQELRRKGVFLLNKGWNWPDNYRMAIIKYLKIDIWN